MFKPSYQGGPYVELLSPAGSNPLKQWNVSGTKAHCTKIFDKSLKGYAFLLEASARLGILKSHLIQSYVAIQVLLPPGQPFTFELSVSDTNNSKRRLFFTNAVKELRRTPLHVTVPIGSVRRGEWITLLVDVPRIISSSFKDQTFRSLDSLVVTAWCKLRRVFTLKEVYRGSEGMFVEIPGTLQLPRAIGANCIQIVGPGGVFDADQYVDIEEFSCHHLSTQMNPTLQTKSIAFGTMVSVKGHDHDGMMSGGTLPRTAKARPTSTVSLPHLQSPHPPASSQTSSLSATKQNKRVPILPQIKSSDKIAPEILPSSPPSSNTVAFLGIKPASRPVSSISQTISRGLLPTSPPHCTKSERSSYDPQLYTDPMDDVQNLSEEIESSFSHKITRTEFEDGKGPRWGNQANVNEEMCGREIRTESGGEDFKGAVTSTNENLTDCTERNDVGSRGNDLHLVCNNRISESRCPSRSALPPEMDEYASRAVSHNQGSNTSDEESGIGAENLNEGHIVSDDMNDPCKWLNGLESRLESIDLLHDRETTHQHRHISGSLNSPRNPSRPSTSHTTRGNPIDEKAEPYDTPNEEDIGQDWVTTYDAEMYGSQVEIDEGSNADGERPTSLVEDRADSLPKTADLPSDQPISDTTDSHSPTHHDQMNATPEEHIINDESQTSRVPTDTALASGCETIIENRTPSADNGSNQAESGRCDVEARNEEVEGTDAIPLVRITENELAEEDICAAEVKKDTDDSTRPISGLMHVEKVNVYHHNPENEIAENVESINDTDGEIDEGEDEVDVDLVYDSKLNCYYEPSTGKYYEIE